MQSKLYKILYLKVALILIAIFLYTPSIAQKYTNFKYRDIHVYNEGMSINTRIVTETHITVKSDRWYYWFDNQSIHITQGGYTKYLLDGAYTVHFESNQLAEKGFFKNGLKCRKWFYWDREGHLQSVEYWRNGKISGKKYIYDSTGSVIIIERYRKGKLLRSTDLREKEQEQAVKVKMKNFIKKVSKKIGKHRDEKD